MLLMKPVHMEPANWNNIVESIDSEFGEGVTKSLAGNMLPVSIERNKNKSVYLIPNEWRGMTEIDFGDYDVQSLGIWLGDETEKGFRISLGVLERIADITRNILIVTEHGGEVFTYGRSVLKESTVEVGKGLERGQKVVVKLESGEVLGLAVLTVSSSMVNRLKNNDLIGKNLVDIGWYIRKMG